MKDLIFWQLKDSGHYIKLSKNRNKLDTLYFIYILSLFLADQ